MINAIQSDSKYILNKSRNPLQNSELGCDCKNKSIGPLTGKCKIENVIYRVSDTFDGTRNVHWVYLKNL